VGQFDLQRPQRAPGGVAQPNAIAGVELTRDIDDKAEPAAAVVDDKHPVVVAEGPGKLDDAVGGGGDRKAAIGS